LLILEGFLIKEGDFLENIFSNLALQSVDESLKPIVRELLTYVNKDIKFYTQNQIQRIIKDLQSGDLRIYVASKDKDSPNYDERYASGKKFNGHSVQMKKNA
jgi:vacuolar-type H+-ATPase subunit E/Vma4